MSTSNPVNAKLFVKSYFYEKTFNVSCLFVHSFVCSMTLFRRNCFYEPPACRFCKNWVGRRSGSSSASRRWPCWWRRATSSTWACCDVSGRTGSTQASRQGSSDGGTPRGRRLTGASRYGWWLRWWTSETIVFTFQSNTCQNISSQCHTVV